MDPKESVQEIVRRAELDYISEHTLISEYVEYSQYRNVNQIDAYLNSKHITGDTDDLGREKPFFNIVTAAVNIWFRATDIDRKDIVIKATNSKSRMGALLLNIHLQRWMREERFGHFLNKWGRTLSEYGSAVVKFVEQDSKLIPTIVPWNRMISDSINFQDNLKIEVLEMTAAQLRAHPGYDKGMVEDLIEAEGTARESLNKATKDNKAYYYKVYEVHGNLSNATLKMGQGKEPNDSDYDTFTQQMHAVSFVETERDGEKGYDDFTLYSGKEKDDPYMITSLIEMDGRAMGMGAVEHLFEAQWMVNHNEKLIKDQLDLASKVIFQTADPTFVGQNAINSIETGDILTFDIAKGGIQQINNSSHDITSLENQRTSWGVQGKEIVGTPDAISGNTMPSGTAYRQVAILNQEANSLFELMTENKGLALEDMIRKYVMPFLMKQMNNKDEIVASLDDYGIKEIEDTYVKNEAIERRKEMAKKILLDPNALQGGKLASVPDQDLMESVIRSQLADSGSVRYISPNTVTATEWKQLFKDIEYQVEVEITNEQSDKGAVLESLNTLFTNVISLQGRPMSPQEKLIFDQILDTSGVISPIQLDSLQQQQNQPQLPQPQMAPQAPAAPTDAAPAPTP